MAFVLKSYPIVFRAAFDADAGLWREEFLDKSKVSEAERNFYSDMPLVSYTSQYGLGCFEGLKALPQKSGGLSIFRPQRNAARFAASMKGLYMPPFPEDRFTAACVETVRRNAALGAAPSYNSAWEKDSYMSADSVYIRPFTMSEGGIGVGISRSPWVVIICTTVSAYFSSELSGAVTSKRVRATPNGTGWIKAASNYVISALAKHEAADEGFMECVFLDAIQQKYVEEGSSCNIFFYLKSGELVTPELGDTILPGITRASIIELARDMGIKVSERKISIEEALSDTKECFVSGTAAGATTIESLTHNGKKAVFPCGKTGELSAKLRDTIKGIQYGSLPDTKNWMTHVGA